MRRLRRVSVGLLVVLVVLLVWEPTRVAFQAAVMLPSLFDAPVKPLSLFSAAPQRSSVPYRPGPPGQGPDLAEVWLPSWASASRQAGGMLIVFGVNNLGRNHPQIARVAETLARSGVAVVVPDSRTLLEGRLEVEEIDGVVRAFELIAARPEVDDERLGIVGFSVGGSLALLAAADERIRDRVDWVNAFGAYADAETYLASVAAHAYRLEGRVVDWTPTPLAREVFLRFMLDAVDDEGDRARLRDALGEPILAAERPAPDPDLRERLETEVARTVHDLLTARHLEVAAEAIAELPPDVRDFIDAISPARHLDGLRAEVHLMHEREDHHVPFVESRRLAELYREAALLAAHTEFRLFDHVQPDDLDLIAAAPELVKLLLHVRTLMERTL